MNHDLNTAVHARYLAGRSSKATSLAHARVRQRGFTLIEVMIVVAVIALLTTLAYPSYTAYITKTRRKAAEACLSEYANFMERYYTTNLRYDQSAATVPVPIVFPPNPNIDCAGTGQTGRDYGYTLAKNSTTYTLTATPIAGGLQATRDTLCGALTIDNTGARTPATTGCW